MQKRSTRYAIERFENPKVYNPYVFHRPYLFRWKGSVIPKVLPQTMFVTIISAIVTYLYKQTSINLSMNNSIITVLGLVVSLLLAYRTNTAYDRYSEGLRTWSCMFVAIRNMTRCIWVNIYAEDYQKNSGKIIDDKTKEQHLAEKKTAINLLLGFAIATKRYLREEPVKFDDIKPFILNNDNTDSNSPGIQILVGRKDYFPNNSNNSNDSNGSFSEKFMKNIKELLPTFGSKDRTHNNVPYELTLYISSYIRKQQINKTTDDSTIGILYSNLSALTDCLTTLERILRSPIPLAYAIHLSQVTWIYCLSLPFQLLQDLSWLTIPVTFIVVMTFLGVEKIASEIENPFGWDENDLGLDDFCGLLNRELCNITSEPIPPMDDWIFRKENVPLNLCEVKSSLSSNTGEKNNDSNDTVINVEENENDNNNDTAVKIE